MQLYQLLITFPVLTKGRQVPHLRRSVLFSSHTQAFRPGLTFGTDREHGLQNVPGAWLTLFVTNRRHVEAKHGLESEWKSGSAQEVYFGV